MDYLVEFLESGARIIKDPTLIEKKKGLPNTILNPEIKHLKGISPSFWYQDGDQVAHLPLDATRKNVITPISEGHSFDTDRIKIQEEKAQEIYAKLDKVEKAFLDITSELDAKRHADMHNILKSMAHDRKELMSTIWEIDEKYMIIVKDLEEQLNKKNKKLQVATFLYILAVILLKFI